MQLGKRLARAFSTVNSDEMNLFKTLTNWWHPSGPMQILYSYNYHRTDFLKKHATSPQSTLRLPFKGLRALDVGCGAGFLSESLARLGADVTALDPNPTSFNEAVAHQGLKPKLRSLQYHNESLEQFLEKNQTQQASFDIVTSMEVIEHVDNPQGFLKSIQSAAKPGGLIMLSTIQRSLSTWLTHIVAAEKVLGIVPKGTHHHDKFINRSELESMMRKYDVEPIDSLELDLSWKGEFEKVAGGGNYLVMGKKQIAQE